MHVNREFNAQRGMTSFRLFLIFTFLFKFISEKGLTVAKDDLPQENSLNNFSRSRLGYVGR